MNNKKLRSMTWDDYDISVNRYHELKAFCMQYEEKKKKMHYGLRAVSYDGTRGGISAGSPTERQAINNVIYGHDVQMIEEAAMKANLMISEWILESVTEDKAYEQIIYNERGERIPCGKTDFYAYRKLFYHYLDMMIMDTKLGTK